MNVSGAIGASIKADEALKKDNGAELKKALTEFESLFIGYMLKTMKESVAKGDLFHGGSGEEVYNSLFDTELARLMASGHGIGLKDMMMREMGGAEEAGGAGEAFTGRAFVPYTPLKIEETRDEPVDGPSRPEADNGFRFPVAEGFKGVSSKYGVREDPFTGHERFHHGVDIAAKEGSPVYPAAEGRVIFSGTRGGYGNVVEVLHENGLVTRYGHNSKNLVKEGDRVTTRDAIASVGSTGRSTGPHLHFEILKDGSAIDPSGFRFG